MLDVATEPPIESFRSPPDEGSRDVDFDRVSARRL
jgi:hypothetical protein